MPQVVIDPGHGGHDVHGRSTPYGARAGATWEKDLNLRLAERVAAHLGGDAILTRAEDRNLALAERAGLARASRARAFISLHGRFDHAGNEVYVHSRGGHASQLLGRSVQRELGGGIGTDELAVLHPETLGADTAGCLVECGYPADFDRLGSSIARGVRSFLGSSYRGPATFTPPAITTITIDNSTGFMSEHFITVTAPGDVSINGQVTANVPPSDEFVVQLDGAAGPGPHDPGVLLHQRFPLTAGTPLLFSRTVAITRPGRYRIVFYMADPSQPSSLSVTGSFFL